jgi:hypothetical protein
MGIDIKGFSLSHSNNSFNFGSTGTKVDSSGRLMSPGVPAMAGYRSGPGTTITDYPWAIDAMQVNTNTCWNTSTFLFTCPVAGVYYTSLSFLAQGGNSTVATSTVSGYSSLLKNGVLVNFTHWNTCDCWDNQHFEICVFCNAGDTLGWSINKAPGPVTGTGGGYTGQHNMSCIWLVG